MDTDASEHAVRAVLSQIKDDEERVIAYYSKLYSRIETTYYTSRKELLAVVEALRQFRPYILRRRCRVRSDHAALRFFYKAPNLIGQQARWLDLLGEYDFQIEFRAGSKHQNADALSRRNCRSCVFCGGSRKLECFWTCATGVGAVPEAVHEPDPADPWSPEALRRARAEDHELRDIVSWRTGSDIARPWSNVVGRGEATKEYWSQWDLLVLKDGILYRQSQGTVIPDGFS